MLGWSLSSSKYRNEGVSCDETHAFSSDRYTSVSNGDNANRRNWRENERNEAYSSSQTRSSYSYSQSVSQHERYFDHSDGHGLRGCAHRNLSEKGRAGNSTFGDYRLSRQKSPMQDGAQYGVEGDWSHSQLTKEYSQPRFHTNSNSERFPIRGKQFSSNTLYEISRQEENYLRSTEQSRRDPEFQRYTMRSQFDDHYEGNITLAKKQISYEAAHKQTEMDTRPAKFNENRQTYSQSTWSHNVRSCSPSFGITETGTDKFGHLNFQLHPSSSYTREDGTCHISVTPTSLLDSNPKYCDARKNVDEFNSWNKPTDPIDAKIDSVGASQLLVKLMSAILQTKVESPVKHASSNSRSSAPFFDSNQNTSCQYPRLTKKQRRALNKVKKLAMKSTNRFRRL